MPITRPALTDPLLVEYRAAGPYDVTNGVQRTDGYVFPADRDLRVSVPAPLSRERGLTLRGGRNVLIEALEVAVNVDYAASSGAARAVANRAIYLDHRTAGVVHVEGLLVTGTQLYEGINLLGTAATTWQLVNVLVADPVRWWPTGNTGVGSDHDGGDVLQTLGSWAALRVEGLEARGATYQGLFCKREAGYTSGPISLTRVSLPNYSGPGAAYYSNPDDTVDVSGSDVYVQPAPTSYGVSPGVVGYRSSTKTAASLVYGSMNLLGVASGVPASPVLTGAPGISYEGHSSMPITVVQGGLASGTGTTVQLQAPARKVGDVVQFVSQSQYPATPQTTTGYTKVVDSAGFTVWQQDTTVDTPAGNARLNFSGSGSYSAFFQVINGGTANPNQPTTPTPVGGIAGLTMPARGFFSGGSGAEIDQNTGKGFGPWRGSSVDFLAHWADAYNGTVWDLPGIEGSNGPAYRFKGLLDLAAGGPENGFSSGSTNNRFPAVANGADDAKFRAMVIKLRTLRTIDGVLYPTILRLFHELDGNWFRWSVTSANLSDAAKIWKRWRAIAKTEYPELIFALCFNADSANTDVTAEQIWDAFGGADLYGTDRYNQYPTIGTNRAGGYTSFADGSTSGTVSNPRGIERHRQLALKKGVPIYVPEYANNGYDTGTPQNASDDPYWIQTVLSYYQANAGTAAGKFLAEGYFNVTGKEQERWPVYRTDGGVIRHPAVASGYRAWFQSNG